MISRAQGKKLPTQLPLSFMAFRFFSFFDFASPSFSLPSRETVLWILIFSLRRDVPAFIVITEYAGNLPLDQCPVARRNAVTFYAMRNWFLESPYKISDIYYRWYLCIYRKFEGARICRIGYDTKKYTKVTSENPDKSHFLFLFSFFLFFFFWYREKRLTNLLLFWSIIQVHRSNINNLWTTHIKQSRNFEVLSTQNIVKNIPLIMSSDLNRYLVWFRRYINIKCNKYIQS